MAFVFGQIFCCCSCCMWLPLPGTRHSVCVFLGSTHCVSPMEVVDGSVWSVLTCFGGMAFRCLGKYSAAVCAVCGSRFLALSLCISLGSLVCMSTKIEYSRHVRQRLHLRCPLPLPRHVRHCRGVPEGRFSAALARWLLSVVTARGLYWRGVLSSRCLVKKKSCSSPSWAIG